MNTVEFGSLFHFIRNGMNIKQDKSGEGLPITRIETIADARVDSSRVGYAGLKESDCLDWMMEPGDILFSHINSVEHIGKCAVYHGIPEKLVHGMNLLCLRCDTKKLLPEFAKYLIRSPSFRARLYNFINKAVNQASVSIGNLKTIPVSVPSLDEQKRIADILDRAEVLRAKRRVILVHLDELTQAIFFEMFGDPMINPKQIETAKLESLCTRITDGTHQPPEWSDTGHPFLFVSNIISGEIDFETQKFISDKTHAELTRRCPIEVGDILYSTVGSYGVPVIVRTSRKFAFQRHIAHLKPNSKVLDSEFLRGMLASTPLKRQADKVAR
ncbi:MAG TPA: restriction endonuclease subunit S, partial [Syntrophorhabdaceae bacterium]|nr:restriction endonuclease subunit S [Syntrophorhabdaceae bacterium]